LQFVKEDIFKDHTLNANAIESLLIAAGVDRRNGESGKIDMRVHIAAAQLQPTIERTNPFVGQPLRFIYSLKRAV